MAQNPSSHITLTVVVSCYNVTRFLPAYFDILSRQWPTREDYEIIFVNDASTDDTLQVLQQYAATNPHARIIDKPVNQGLSEARNTGIDNARGEWITFPDSDDGLVDGALEALMNVADTTSLNAIVHNYARVSETEYNEQLLRTDIASHITPIERHVGATLVSSSSCAKLYRTSALRDISLRFYDVAICEDTIFVATFFSAYQQYLFIEEDLYVYIKHPGSLTDGIDQARCRRMTEGFLQGIGIVNDLYRQGKIIPQYRNHFCALEDYLMLAPTIHAHYSLAEMRNISKRLKDEDALTPFFHTLAERVRIFLYSHPTFFWAITPILRLFTRHQI